MKPKLYDPTAAYCKAMAKVVGSWIKKSVDAFYKFYLDCGMSKADAIWTAIEETQKMCDGVDLTVNFNGPMA